MRKFICLALLLFGSAVAFAQASEKANASPFPEGTVYLKGNYQLYRRLAKLAPEVQGSGMENLANEFRSGGVFAFEGGVRVATRQYIGLTHSRYSNHGSFRMYRQLQSPTVGTITTWNDATLKESVSYTGLNYSYLFPISPNQRFLFAAKSGIGLWGYHSSAAAFSNTEEIKKTGLGYQLGAGFELRLAKNLSWTADLELLTGGVTIQEGERENLSQIRCGTGLCIRF